MWPTPTATPYGSSQNGINGVGGEFERPSANKPSLENMARMQADWPTPVASDSTRTSDTYVQGNPTLSGMAKNQWPTPRATDNRGPGESAKRDGGPSLTTVAHAWPTPMASDVHGPRDYDGKRGVGLNTKAANWPTPTTNPQAPNKSSNTVNGPTSLEEAALRAWPTPTATDAKASGAAGYSTDSGRHSGTTLTDAAVRQWATPAARDWKDGACEDANVPTKALLGRQAVRWATPQAHDLQPPKTPEQIAAMKDRTGAMWATPVASPNANRMTKAAPSHGNSHGHVLAGQAASWPTPVATLQSTAKSTTGASTLNGVAQATTSGLPDLTTSTDGEPTSLPEDPSPPSSRRRVLNPRFVEALMGLPPGWISVLPTLPTTRWKFSTSDDLTSSASPETESSPNNLHSPSSISDEEPLEDDDADAA